MNKEFLLNIGFLLAINLLIKPFYIFAIDLQVQNTVGKEAYGVYFTLFNLTLILEILNDFGMRNFLRRYLAQHPHLLKKYFPHLLSAKLLLSLGYFALVVLVAAILGYLAQYWHIILIIVAGRILVSFIELFRANLAGLAHYRTDSFISVLHRFLLILICGVLLYVPELAEHFTIEWFILSELVALFFVVLISGFLLRRQVSDFQFKFKYPLFLSILKQSYPYALIILLMMIYNRVDAIMIEKIVPNGAAEVGIYAAAYRLLDAASMFSLLFANLLLPMFAKMLQNKESIQSLVETSFQLIMAAAIAGVIGIYFFSEEIMVLFYTEATAYWGEILGVLMISFIAISGTHIIGTALVANDSVKRLNQIYLLGIVVNIVLNLIFIPTYQALGAAITTCCTQFFVLFGEIWLIHRILKLKQLSMLIRTVSYALVLIATGFLLMPLLQQTFSFWFLQLLLFGLLAIILALAMRMIRLNALREI